MGMNYHYTVGVEGGEKSDKSQSRKQEASSLRPKPEGRHYPSAWGCLQPRGRGVGVGGSQAESSRCIERLAWEGAKLCTRGIQGLNNPAVPTKSGIPAWIHDLKRTPEGLPTEQHINPYTCLHSEEKGRGGRPDKEGILAPCCRLIYKLEPL